MIYRLITIFIFSLLLFSCKTINFDGEPPAAFDSEPPVDYNPIFIMQKENYNPNLHKNPKVILSSIDVRQVNSVKLKLHIIDSNYIYLKGLNKGNYKNYWCEVVDVYNGKETKIKNYKISEINDESNIKTSVAVVMDHSGSMGENRAYVVQEAVKNLILKKNKDDALALIKYDNKVGIEAPLSNNQIELISKHKINGLQGYGNLTAIKDGIFYGINELKKAEKSSEKAVIVFTDGWDNSSNANLTNDSLIRLARANNVIICGVDFGENINKEFIKSFAESTSGIYHHIYKTNEFALVFEDLYNRLKNNYVIEYSPKDYGRHKVRVKLCFPNDTLIAEGSYDNTPDLGAIGLIPILFDFNKSTIQKQSEDAIDNIYLLLTAYPKMEIELRGHTDNLNSSNDPDYNLKLSQKRAEAVKQALVKKGISANRIYTKGFGDTEPIGDNNTEEGRAINRRTEFVIIKR